MFQQSPPCGQCPQSSGCSYQGQTCCLQSSMKKLWIAPDRVKTRLQEKFPTSDFRRENWIINEGGDKTRLLHLSKFSRLKDLILKCYFGRRDIKISSTLKLVLSSLQKAAPKSKKIQRQVSSPASWGLHVYTTMNLAPCTHETQGGDAGDDGDMTTWHTEILQAQETYRKTSSADPEL